MAISDRQIRRLENIGARTWPAERVVPLGGWSLSIDRGVTRRANSVLPNGWKGGPALDDRIAAVEDSYRQAGLQPCFKMTRASLPGGLDDHLARRGYQTGGHSVVLTAALHEIECRPSIPVELTPDRTPDWVRCSWPAGPRHANVESRVRIADRVGRPKLFALVRLDGYPAGAAMASVAQGWGCVTAVRTPPEFRRRGVARALVAALAGWAGEQDAGNLFLQVEEANGPARSLYASIGFREAYRYHYRTLERPVVS